MSENTQTGMTMNQAEDLVMSILRRNNIPLRAPSSGETPNVPRPEDVDTGNRTRIFKGIKQITFEEYTNLTEEERKQYVFFVRESAEATFGFVGIGNLKYTMVPEDIRGLDCGYFPVCSGDTGSTEEPDGLLFDILENGGMHFNKPGPANEYNFKYTLDDGQTWAEFTLNDENRIYTIHVQAGDKLYVKGTNDYICTGSTGTGGYGLLGGTTIRYNVSRSIMWLMYEDDIESHTTLVDDQSFASLFSAQNVVDASGLILPENTTVGCYASMFQRCYALTSVPILPAENVLEYAYYNMFRECTSLVTPPEIHALIVGRYGMTSMFESCTALETVPELFANGTGMYAFYKAFAGCTSLGDLHDVTMHGTSFGENACQEMFRGCTGMTKTPVFTVSSFHEYGGSFRYAFAGCTSLVSSNITLNTQQMAPVVFYGTFSGCTSLENTIDFSQVTGLQSSCFAYMYYDCKNLTTVTGDLRASTASRGAYLAMFSGCDNLVRVPAILATNIGDSGCTKMFENCLSLADAPQMAPTYVATYGCYAMFKGCVSLIDPPAIVPSTIQRYGFSQMFMGCTRLTRGLTLTPRTADLGVYKQMYEGCVNLENAGEMSAIVLNQESCMQMYKDCIRLREVWCRATDISTHTDCVSGFILNVASEYGNQGTLYCPADMIQTWRDSGEVHENFNIIAI